MRTCEKNNPVDTKVSEEGGAGDVPDAKVPVQPMVQPMEIHGDCRDPPAAHGEAHAGAGGCLGGGCNSMGDLWREGPCSQAGAACPWRKSDTCCSSLGRTVCPWDGLIGEVHGDLSPMGGDPTVQQRKDSGP